jgi:GT2 family glycosyltransferase
MRVDVIVCTYDRAALLRDALESLLAQETGPDLAFELLVVDNASRDSTRAVVDACRASGRATVRYVHEPVGGVAHARNRGVREATAEWLAFFDDDQLADRAWLRELASAARATGARCVGGRVALVLEATPPPALPAFCRGLLGETPDGDAPRPFAGKALPGTGNALVHRGVFEAVGTFDVGLLHGAEDEDFFRRARAAGFATWFAPAACVAHRVAAYRLTPRYLAWVASRHGVQYALRDAREGGRRRVAWHGALRAVQALATLASHARARARRDPAALLECRCRLARAAAYERQALRLLAPWLGRARFLEGLDFRGERERFGREGVAAP